MSKLICPKCKKEAKTGELYCNSCGSKLMVVLEEKEEISKEEVKPKKEEKKHEVNEEAVKEEKKKEKPIVEAEPEIEQPKKAEKPRKPVAVTSDGRIVTDYVAYKPKKKKTGVIIAIIVIILLLALIGVLLFMVLNNKTPINARSKIITIIAIITPVFFFFGLYAT